MGSAQRPRSTRGRRTVGIAIGATLVLVVLIVGLAFANSIGAGRVAENARSLHWANASLGTAALTRSALVQATTFVDLENAGQVEHDDVATAMTDASAARDRLVDLRETGGDGGSLPFLIHFIAPVDQALEALEEGDHSLAKEVITTDLESAYMSLVESLQSEQDAIQSAIDLNTAANARMNDFVTFFLTLAIPAGAILIYRTIARRAVREHQIKADLEVEAERSVGRAKDEFIAGLSHELRTPLTSIYGFAEVLTDGGTDDPETTQELSQIIANEAAEMTRMVDDLLAAARIESTGVEIVMSEVPLFEIVESAITPFERAGLDVKRSVEPLNVNTDAARLRHVIVNLLSNAARHGGKQIGVEVSTGEGVVDIEVWDTGAGVPEDQVEHLFERFAHGGSSPLLTGSVGLGLAIAARLTTMLGGKLSYQRFAKKTYFTVTLPIGIEEEPEPVAELSTEPVAAIIRALSA